MIQAILLIFYYFNLFNTISSFSINLRSNKCNYNILKVSKYDFLYQNNENNYISNILRFTNQGIDSCIKDNYKLLEVEFPVIRKQNDLSVSQTLDNTIAFTFQYVEKYISNSKQYKEDDVILLLPDKKEANYVRSNKPNNFNYLIGSLDDYPKSFVPKLLFIINPGFNVDEYIKIASIYPSDDNVKIIINGNINRLRNGYYPGIFYPKLSQVSKSFYSKSVQAMTLSSLSLQGNKLASWQVRVYPNDYELVMLKSNQQVEVVYKSNKEIDPMQLWKIANELYSNK